MLKIKEVRSPVRVETRTWSSEIWTPPGIVTGAAYAAGDALGGVHTLSVPVSGILQGATYWDQDDEGLAVDLVIFRKFPTVQIADNAAMDLADDNLLRILYVIKFTSSEDFTNGRVFFVDALTKGYKTTAENAGKFYIQARAQGALNIAAGALPRFQIDILADV